MLKELGQDRDYLVRLCTELIEKTGLRDNLRLKVSPMDLETAEMLKAGIQQRLGEMRNLSVEPSADVAGGCILESQWGAIDARLDTQLDGVLQALGGPLEGGTPNGNRGDGAGA